ncbi:MAG: helix-turn-helix domain-containing protein [Pseudonocardiaceae bacterium]
MTEADREEISRGIAEGVEGTVIAARMGRSPSVVSREITRHGGRARYRGRGRPSGDHGAAPQAQGPQTRCLSAAAD